VTLPNFLIIGAQKTGTTSLFHYVEGHPEVFMCRPKEPDFFIEERNWSRGSQWYESLFDRADGAGAVGEASVCYTMDPTYTGVPERIARMLPQARLIYMVREPVDRMRSEYLHLRYLRKQLPKMPPEDLPIERALIEHPQYLWSSKYAHQIELYLRYFPLERLLVVVAEDLRHRRRETLRRVFEFLGVPPDWEPPDIDQEFNRSGEEPKRTPSARRLDRIPGYRLAVSAIPASLKGKLASRMGLADEGEAMLANGALSEDLRRQLEGSLREDVRRLREYAGPGFDGWGLA
jgi:hypothetical protein